MDNIKKIADLKEKYKDDPRFKDKFNSVVTKEDFEKVTVSVEENLNQFISEREYVLSPVLPIGGSMMVFGEAGVGKSYFTFNLAYALATGGNFLKYSVPKPQKIAYFDGELGKMEVARYLQEVTKNHPVKNYFPQNLKTLSYDQFTDQSMPRVEEHPNVYFEYIMDNKFNGMILDNLATCTSIDENNPKEWKIIQRLILRLRFHDKFFIFVHHAAPNQNKERGISARRDVIHAVVSLEKIEDFVSPHNRIKVSHPKGRFLKGSDKHPFEAVHKIDGTWDLIDIEVSSYEKVIDCLNAGYSGREISKYVGISPGMVSRYKNKAFLEGKLFKK